MEASLRSDFHELGERLDQLGLTLKAQADTRIDELDEAIRHLSDETATKLESASRTSSDAISQVDRRVTELQGPRNVSLSVVMTNLESFQQTSTTRLAELEAKQKESESRLVASLTEANDLSYKTKQSFDDQIRRIDAALTDSIDNLSKALSKSETRQQTSVSDVQTLLTRHVTQTESNLTGLRDEFVHTYAAGQTALDKQLTEVAAELKRISQTVTSNDTKQTSALKDETEQLRTSTQRGLDDLRKLIEKQRSEIDEQVERARTTAQAKTEEVKTALNDIAKTVNENADPFNERFSALGTALSSRIDSVEHKSNEADDQLSHRIDLLNEFAQRNKSLIESLTAQEAKNLSEMKQSLRGQKAQLQSTIDQLREKVASHIARRKTEIQALNAELDKGLSELQLALDGLKSTHVESFSSVRDSIQSEAIKLRGELDERTRTQSAANEALAQSVEALKSEFAATVVPRVDSIQARQALDRTELDASDQALRSAQNSLGDRQTALSEEVGKLAMSIEQAEHRVVLRIESEAAQLRGVDGESQKSIGELARRADRLRALLADADSAIKNLQRVHFYNKEMESFHRRFDEILVYIEQFKSTMCDFVHGTFQASAAPQADRQFADAAVPSPVRPLPDRPNGGPPFKIRELANDTEIGRLIRRALGTHANVIVVVPAATRVLWNRTVQLRPHQSLSILGSDNSVIQMVGVESFNRSKDCSRVVMDGFSKFEVKGLRIEAQCGPEIDREPVDLRAFCVVRGWDAMGPAVVNLHDIIIDSDRTVVNIAACGCGQMYCRSCRVTNTRGAQGVAFVTAESGAYPHGYATLVARGTRLSGDKITWGQSEFVVISKGAQQRSEAPLQ
jgi:hypothetical protein